MRRSARLAAIGLVLSLAAAPAGAEELDRVRVGVIGLISDAPLFIAQHEGYFRAQRIEVAFIPFPAGPAMVAPLGTGELDVAAGASSAGLFNAALRGIAVKIVADKASTPPGPSYMPLLVRKDLVESGRVKSFADLKGLRVAEAGRGGSPGSTLNAILRQGGLAYDDVEHVPNLAYPQHVTALANRAIDASITTEPSATEAIEAGYAVRFSDGSAYPDQEVAVLLYGGDFIAKHRDAGERFMVAYIEGLRFYAQAISGGYLRGPKAGAVIDILAAEGEIKDKALLGRLVANGVNPDGHVNEASLRTDLAFYRAQNLISGPVAVEDLVDASFVEAALKQLGPWQP
ncbi:MAG TPA: ABC transporter substrate-binding protein [Stellaceae bacterium]|nr:ABC transporter substrate-binding protein [Stellaceae bacterium]